MIDLSTAFSFDSRGLLTFYSTVFHRNSQYEVQREVARERGLQTNKINSPRQNSNILQMHIHCVLCQVLCSGDMRLLIEKRLFLHQSRFACISTLFARPTQRGDLIDLMLLSHQQDIMAMLLTSASLMLFSFSIQLGIR